MAGSFKTPVLSRAKKPALNSSIPLILSPPLAESTKLVAVETTIDISAIVPGSAPSSSENKKSNSAKPKRARRKYDLFKVGHLVDKKDGVLDSNGKVIGVRERIEALFKPISTNDGSPQVAVPEPSSSSSDDTPEAEAELPADPKYPTLLKSTITTRDIYDCQRLCTRLNFIKDDMERMNKETSPRIEQQIKKISESKKQIYEMYQQKLDRIDREMVKHKFPSSSDVAGERKTDKSSSDITGASTSITSRPSLDDFVGSRKRSVEEPVAAPSKAEKAAVTKRRRTMCGTLGTLSNAESYRSRGVIVTTSLHESEQAFVANAVAKLGGFTIQEDVSRTTTHLICGAPRRTLNVLRAVCRGCWIVSTEWVSASLDAGHWLSEEEFETVTYFPNCRGTRLSRQETAGTEGKTESKATSGRRRQKAADIEDDEESGPSLGLSCVLPILAGTGGIYVSPDLVKPRQHDVVQLVRLCSGRLARSISDAKVVIASSYPQNSSPLPDSVAIVSPNWLLDSIMSTAALPTSNFALRRLS